MTRELGVTSVCEFAETSGFVPIEDLAAVVNDSAKVTDLLLAYINQLHHHLKCAVLPFFNRPSRLKDSNQGMR